MLLRCPESLCAFVRVPAVFHLHYMNRAAIELLDYIPLTGLASCGYQDIGAIPVPLSFILGGVIHPLYLVSWCPGVLCAVGTCSHHGLQGLVTMRQGSASSSSMAAAHRSCK